MYQLQRNIYLIESRWKTSAQKHTTREAPVKGTVEIKGLFLKGPVKRLLWKGLLIAKQK